MRTISVLINAKFGPGAENILMKNLPVWNFLETERLHHDVSRVPELYG